MPQNQSPDAANITSGQSFKPYESATSLHLPSTEDRDDQYLNLPRNSRRESSGSEYSGYNSSDALLGKISPVASRGDHDFIASIDYLASNGPFAFSIDQLQHLVDPKNIKLLRALGGVNGLYYGLRTCERGIDGDERYFETTRSLDRFFNSGEFSGNDDALPSFRRSKSSFVRKSKENFYDRIKSFGRNELPKRQSPSIFQLFLSAMKDNVIILLSICAVISLALGLYQTFRTREEHEKGEPRVDWVEGVAILCAVLIVTIVTAVNDWQKERQFAKLSKKVDNYAVTVIRSNNPVQVPVDGLLVGDILVINAGDVLPVDGVLVKGLSIKSDESSVTGEADQIQKAPASICLSQSEDAAFDEHWDPFMLSGSRVLEGSGCMLVISVGPYSLQGKTMMAMRHNPEMTPLQYRLGKIANFIAYVGGIASLILFLILFIRFLAKIKGDGQTATQRSQNFFQILIIAVTLLVVVVPEGLPLAVTLSLAYATKRMLSDNNLVRVLRACETMGNATVICSDKTGTLTLNKMTAVTAVVDSKKFMKDENALETSSMTDEVKSFTESSSFLSDISEALSDQTNSLLLDSIALNSTAQTVQQIDPSDQNNGNRERRRNEPISEQPSVKFLGSKTECALLEFATENLKLADAEDFRSKRHFVRTFPFNSNRKSMGVVVQNNDGKYTLHVKGMPERMFEKTDTIISDNETGFNVVPLDDEKRNQILQYTTLFASGSLRVLAHAYKYLDFWPPSDFPNEDEDKQWDFLFENLTLVGIFGIMDPVRPDVPDAVLTCQRAGVQVKMVTGDNIQTASAIAMQCGILTPDGITMTGPQFRALQDQERLDMVNNLEVLARSSPLDKQILVDALQRLDHIVAATGDGTNDGPALKKADVGFSMGITGTEVAKEASDIILLDDNFTSIVKATAWGRAVNDSVKKFLQFQLSVNLTALLITFITSVANKSEKSVLTAVQLLWVNLIMDTMAALALATDPPTPAMLQRKPESKYSSLVDISMAKMIVFEAAYQVFVTLLLHFGRSTVFKNMFDTAQMNTVVFNTFVWMQIFNEINCRRLGRNFNVFENLTKNWLFIFIFMVMVGVQTMIVFVGGAAFSVTQIDVRGWAISIGFGFGSLVVGFLVRCLPDRVFMKMVPQKMVRKIYSRLIRRRKSRDAERGRQFQPYDVVDPEEVINLIRNELSMLRRIRGGRLFGQVSNKSKTAGSRENTSRQSVNSLATVGLMVPVTTLVTEATGRLTDTPRSLSPTKDSSRRNSPRRKQNNPAIRIDDTEAKSPKSK